jgi:type II secretory ATPase GspE/PulE/Tfp pilus assembly ATPase PilB-like protein
VRELIYQGTMTELNRYLKTIDFTSFSMAAAQKVTNGVTTIEEVFRVLPHSALCH